MICSHKIWRTRNFSDKEREDLTKATRNLPGNLPADSFVLASPYGNEQSSGQAFVWSRNGSPDISRILIWTSPGNSGEHQINIHGIAEKGRRTLEESGFVGCPPKTLGRLAEL